MAFWTRFVRAFVVIMLVMIVDVAPAAVAQGSTPEASGSLAIHFVDDFGTPVAGGCFSITDVAGDTHETCDDGNGIARQGNLPVGNVWINQTVGPNGYSLANPISATVVAAVETIVSLTTSAEAPSTSVTDESFSTADVEATPDLVITKSAAEETVDAGNSATFLITIENVGEGIANGVVLSDTLPAGINWSASTPSCTIDAQALNCSDLDVLEAGGIYTVSVSGVVSIANCGVLSNTASVSATNEPELATANNTSTAQISVHCPFLSYLKTSDQSTVSASQPIGFTITMTNIGDAVATDATLTDPLPDEPGLNWTIDGGTGAADCAISNGSLDCGFGDLEPAASVAVHISSPTTPESCGIIENTAYLDASNTATGQASAEIIVNCSDIIVTKTASLATITVGEEIRFAIEIANAGQGIAFDAVLHDTLSDQVEWTLEGTNASACEIDGTALDCDFGDMEGLGVRSFEIVGTTGREDCGSISNTATVSASSEPVSAGSNNESSATVTITCGTIVINKTAEDGDGGTVPQEGACFELRVNAALVADGCTESGGNLTFTDLPVGTYAVYETSVPENYELPSAWATVVLEPGATETLEITNTLASVEFPVFALICDADPGTVSAGDVAAGTLPSGCVAAPDVDFTVTEDSGAPQSFTTGSNGGFVVTATIFSTVVVIEDAATIPGGFEPAFDQALLTKTIESVQPEQEGLVFVAIPSSGALQITKYTCPGDNATARTEFDTTGAPVDPACSATSGVSFAVDGGTLAEPITLTTDGSGQTSTTLDVGEYTVTENTTQASTSIVISADATTSLVVSNFPALPTATPTSTATPNPTSTPTSVPTAAAPSVSPTPLTVVQLPSTGTGSGGAGSGIGFAMGLIAIAVIVGLVLRVRLSVSKK